MTAALAVEPTQTERPAELQAPGYEIFIGLLAVLLDFTSRLLRSQPKRTYFIDIRRVGSTCSAASHRSSGYSGSSGSSV